MSEHGIAGIGRIGLEGVERLSQANEALASHPEQVHAQAGGALQPRQPQLSLNRPLFQMADVHLKFVIDAETKDVTILILDRTSRKVVRTIPPEEMAKIDPGELLQLFI